VTWIDCQSRSDVLHLSNLDPVAASGVEVGPERRNPLVWQLRFREMLPPEVLRRMRTRFYRLHFQFIMANGLRAPYDYFMLVCGPVPVVEWARRRHDVVAQFSPDGVFLESA
jgi:hypothetical protein